MKIKMDFSLNKQDFADLTEQFDKVVSYEANKGEFDNVVVDTNDLTYQLFEDWLKDYVDIGYSIVFNKPTNEYLLTDIA